jgi:uncharacterized protein YigA (DUF484 family)
MQPLLKLLRWEEDIISLLETNLQVCRSDAQGILDAQSSLLRQAWKDQKTPRQTADLIIQLSTQEDTTHD